MSIAKLRLTASTQSSASIADLAKAPEAADKPARGPLLRILGPAPFGTAAERETESDTNTNTNRPRKRGRKPAMTRVAARRLRYLVACRVLLDGVSRQKVARELGVSPRTIYTWIQSVLHDESPESVSIKRSPEPRRNQAARSRTDLKAVLEMQSLCALSQKRPA